MYDKSKRCGLLYEKIRYSQRKNKPKSKKSSKVNSKQVVGDDEINELVAFFDSCVLPRDKRELSDKLKASAAVRKISNQTNRNIFDKSCHLYRVDSELVSYSIHLNGQ